MASVAAIQFFLTIKCLFNLALRQAMGLTQSLLKLRGWTGGQHREPSAKAAERDDQS